ncbi:RmlC-like cupin domain-containing protein [Stachybotrys elegans]|uniref:RmlC-like cupin domain-containing protein n=1 Tax=Stachybotrys elegans TaxID=80388 RepID=A0A8K0SKA2_9HYPO|nr:RmlC-like cupin domain-containing protein [Stachybotrys elegans]
MGLIPNIEGGYYAESFRDEAQYDNRSVSSAIYYLLEGSAGRSRWHRLDAAEVWHYYAGAPLSLFLSFDNGTPTREKVLGSDVFYDKTPQVVVEPFEWQQAQSHGEWTLVGTTVAPAFTEEGFELAEPGWEPNT